MTYLNARRSDIYNSIIQYLHWWGNKVNPNGNFRISHGNTSSESILDSINTLIGETRALKVSPDLNCLLGQFPLNVLNQNLFGVFIQAKVIQKAGISNRLLEVIVGCALEGWLIG